MLTQIKSVDESDTFAPTWELEEGVFGFRLIARNLEFSKPETGPNWTRGQTSNALRSMLVVRNR